MTFASGRRLKPPVLKPGHRLVVILAVATAISRALFAGRDLLAFREFGAGPNLDAYLVGVTTSLFVAGVFTGAASLAIVPALIDHAERGDEEAFVSRVLGHLGVLLVSAAVLAWFGAPAVVRIVAPGLDRATFGLALESFQSLAPLIILVGGYNLAGAVLQARGRLVMPEALHGVAPICCIAYLLVSRNASTAGLGRTLVAGTAAEFIIVAAYGRRRGVPRPRVAGWDKAEYEVLRAYLPLVLTGVVMSSTALLDQAMASLLPSGSVTILSAGGKVPTFLLSVGAIALGTLALPTLSSLRAKGNDREFAALIDRWTRLIFIGSIPLVVALIVLAAPISDVLFEHGAIGRSASHKIALVLACYALQLPFYWAGVLNSRALSALRRNRVLLWTSAASVALNAVADVVFIQIIGLPGIALATSMVYLASWLWMRRMISRAVATTSEPVTVEEAPGGC